MPSLSGFGFMGEDEGGEFAIYSMWRFNMYDYVEMVNNGVVLRDDFGLTGSNDEFIFSTCF